MVVLVYDNKVSCNDVKYMIGNDMISYNSDNNSWILWYDYVRLYDGSIGSLGNVKTEEYECLGECILSCKSR